ncbi:MAG TPA: barstar family protein [Actinophytocola sp.]|jgi:RNAse (barnase) inhibitor barstar|nr:barstar family protein [Actinophytocola sp.]
MEHTIDGTQIRSKDDFYTAVAAALSFPDWFGRNLDALADCLRDLSWLPAGEHVLVWSAPAVFRDADPEGYRAVADVLTDTIKPGVFRVLTR